MSPIKLTITKSKIQLVLLLLFFKLVLDLAYIHILSPVYSYLGFTISINSLALIESYIMTFIIGTIISFVIDRPSHFLIWMLCIGTLIPVLSFYAIHSGSRSFMYGMLLSFICIVLVSKLPIIKIGTLKGGRKLGIIILTLMVLAGTSSLFAKGGLHYFNLDFGKVYDYRIEVVEIFNTGLWAYIYTWVFKVINPALIAWALWKKKYHLLIAVIALQSVFFAISSHKSVLFYPVLILAIYFAVKKERVFAYLTWGLILVVIISSFLYLFFDNIWPLSLFIRRVFFVPAQLNFAYFDLFSNIGHVYLSNSILSDYISYPFQYKYTHMVSIYLYGNPNISCNNGFLATSYMHFGYMGMFTFSIIVGLLLWITDMLVYKRIPIWLGISIIIIPFFTLFTSADLFTSLLTHGIILGLMIIFLFGSSLENDKQE